MVLLGLIKGTSVYIIWAAIFMKLRMFARLKQLFTKSKADEIAAQRLEINIKVSAFTASQKSYNVCQVEEWLLSLAGLFNYFH